MRFGDGFIDGQRSFELSSSRRKWKKMVKGGGLLLSQVSELCTLGEEEEGIGITGGKRIGGRQRRRERESRQDREKKLILPY